MSKKIKDTDYLVISARIRAMENTLLTRERMEQMLEARTEEDAVKILQECGYPAFSAANPAEMDAALSAAREAVVQDLGDSAPDARYLDVFKLKYDYHNVKAFLKAAVLGRSPDSMLMDMGRVPAKELRSALEEGKMDELPPILAAAAAEAQEVLDTTRDPQLSDIVLDRGCYTDMLAAAEDTGSDFLRGYVRALIDGANLRALVRTLRMGKNTDFLQGVLLEGGEVSTGEILKAAANGAGAVSELYAPTALADAAQLGAQALQGGALTAFEKACDDAAGAYLSGAKFVPFGEAPLVGYLAARETEFTDLRILLMGRRAGLAPEVIRSRLRESYV